MSQNKFFSPTRTVFPGVQPCYYAIGNTPIRHLCADIPVCNSDKPLRICLQGAGDIRNILQCVYSRQQIGDKRRIEFYVNDCSQAIIARDILLLTLASQAPQEERSLNNFIDLFCSINANLSLDERAGHELNRLLDNLLKNFPAADGFMHIPATEHLWQVKKTWALWKTKSTSLEEALRLRNEQTKKQFNIKAGLHQLPCGELSSDYAVVSEMFINRDLAATATMRDELLYYYQTGNMLKSELQGRVAAGNAKQSTCNWTLFNPEVKQFLNFTSQPFQFLISGSEATDYSADDHSLLTTLKAAYKRLIKAFVVHINNSKLKIIFDVGDCNSFMAQRIPFDITFDIIDTSNLADYLDLASLLLLSSRRLNRHEPQATLWVEFLKSHSDYSNVEQFVNDSLGFPYSLLGTYLQLRCFLPVESSLLVDEYHKFNGSTCRSNLITGLVLKFKPTHYSIKDTPTALQLMPEPSDCVFRQMIDNYLMSLYDLYTGQFFRKEQVKLFCKSIPNLLRLLCSVAQMMDNPKQLFDHLYSKVKKSKAAQSDDPNRHLDVFAFDVQLSSLCLCPPEYQSTQPLHPYFANSSDLETLIYGVKHTLARDHDPCPVVGWIMTNSLTATEFQTSLAQCKTPQEIPSFAWIKHNLDHLQFIDSIQIPFPDTQVEITVPSNIADPRTCPQNVTFLALSLQTGQLLYEPLQTSVKQPQQQLSLKQKKQPTAIPIEVTATENMSGAQEHNSIQVFVSSVFECEKNFRVQLKIHTGTVIHSNSKVALVALCDEKYPLAVNLHIQIEAKETTSRCLDTMVWLPAIIEARQNFNIWMSDEEDIEIILKKAILCMKIEREKLNFASLQKWPMNRPLGVSQSMFTTQELNAAIEHNELPVGHDTYFDVRRDINTMFQTLIDEDAQAQGVIKLSKRRKYFVSVSSSKTGFVGCMPELLITPGGVPVMVLDYLVAKEPLLSDAMKFLIYRATQNDFTITIETSSSCIEFLIRLLGINAQLLSDETSKHVTMDGISLTRSFLVPVYPQDTEILITKIMKDVKLSGQQQFEKYGEHYHETKQMAMSRSRDHCSVCLSCTADLKRCGRCHITLYCNTDCQKKDWKHHKKYCTPNK